LAAEKALMSLPSPLTASDEFIRYKEHGNETVKVTAGLHRQVWVSGTSIFVDVHITNNTKKWIKRLELQLERDVLCYKHASFFFGEHIRDLIQVQAAATTLEKSASQARIFDSNERTILTKSVLKIGMNGWNGVLSHSSDIRTCDLELPRGHATVKCGKYFEVRYFLNVVASTSHNKSITVQLPIVLIHMNSLDVIPNSVAQVAAAIEEKRAKVHQRKRSRQLRQAQLQPRSQEHAGTANEASSSSPSRLARRPSSSASVQGRAFAAPRKQSLDRMRAEAKELGELGKLLDTSPRKYRYPPQQRPIASKDKQKPSKDDSFTYFTPRSNRQARILSDELDAEVASIRARLRRMKSTETYRSAISAGHLEAGDLLGLRRCHSVQSDNSLSSQVGFRELEVGIGLRLESPAFQPSRFESLSAASARQAQFKKTKSGERWKGPSWFSDRKQSRSLERNRERERESEDPERREKQKMMSNCI
jgi:hypothetical protein